MFEPTSFREACEAHLIFFCPKGRTRFESCFGVVRVDAPKQRRSDACSCVRVEQHVSYVTVKVHQTSMGSRTSRALDVSAVVLILDSFVPLGSDFRRSTFVPCTQLILGACVPF